jgi:hypothetical protein
MQDGEREKGYAVPGVPRRDRSSLSGDVGRGSVKRQSDIMREARKSRQEEQEEERKRKQSYYRRVTGKEEKWKRKQGYYRRVTGQEEKRKGYHIRTVSNRYHR